MPLSNLDQYLNTRRYFFYLSIACIGLLGFGLYLEHFRGIVPCPLCVLQRLAYLLIVLFAIGGALHAPGRTGLLIYNGLIFVVAAIGMVIAAYQIWLQQLPADRIPECGPGLSYMLEVLPLRDVLAMIFTGSGECAEVHWRLMGLGIAEWSAISFFILLLISGSGLMQAFMGRPRSIK